MQGLNGHWHGPDNGAANGGESSHDDSAIRSAVASNQANSRSLSVGSNQIRGARTPHSNGTVATSDLVQVRSAADQHTLR